MTQLAMTWAQAGASNAGSAAATGDTGQWLAWGIILLAVAIGLFFLEVLVPTGGLLGLVAGVCAVAGIVLMFRVNTTLGLITTAAAIIALPFLIAFALKVWPNTPFGKWVILRDEQASPERTADHPAPDPQTEGPMAIRVGDTGEAITPLRPVGTCVIGGRREECMARAGSIEPGTPIRVVVVDGSEVYVQAAE